MSSWPSSSHPVSPWPCSRCGSTSRWSSRHGVTVEAITDWAYDHIVRTRFRIGSQAPIRCLPSSSPEPDLILSERRLGTRGHPTRAALAVEVSLSPAAVDLGIKPSVYARGGVDEYWVVLPEQGAIRIHRAPHDGEYQDVRDVAEASFRGATLRTADLPRPR